MQLREGVRLVWNGVLDLVYPPVCLICGREEAESLCDVCRREVVPLSGPFCDRCGTPVGAGRLVCDDCLAGPEPAFAWSQAVGQYTGVLRTAIHRLKYDSKAALAAPLGALLDAAFDTPSPLLPPGQQFDCIVPVPLHPSKYRSRGFNQAERLGRILSTRRDWPLDRDGLLRTRRTRTQTTLDAAGRRRNVQGVFAAKTPLHFDGMSVLLLDDVLTTMSTVGECSRVLRNAGAKRVAVLALARGL